MYETFKVQTHPSFPPLLYLCWSLLHLTSPQQHRLPAQVKHHTNDNIYHESATAPLFCCPGQSLALLLCVADPEHSSCSPSPACPAPGNYVQQHLCSERGGFVLAGPFDQCQQGQIRQRCSGGVVAYTASLARFMLFFLCTKSVTRNPSQSKQEKKAGDERK